MSFSFRDKGRLSDRLRGKTCDEILKELRDHLHQDRSMSFEPSPSWGGFSSSPAFARAGFPFMDQDMMSRPDMRAHFEDLATRHPEFAEHLRPTAWGTTPETETHFFHPAASGPNLYRQRHPSGGSGSSSYGEGEAIPIPVIHEDSGGGETTSTRSRTRKIPQYGMRNTVDLGESQKCNPVDGSEGDARNQRSWSAPPDNRTQVEAPQSKRFVTRVEVNNSPKNPNTSSENEASSAPSVSNASGPGKPPPFPKTSGVGPAPQSTTKHGNVRHIPIFVEGRDEPILHRPHEGQSFSSSHSSSGFGQPNVSYSYASASPGSHSNAFASSHSPSGSSRSQSSAPHPQASGTYPHASGPYPQTSTPHSQTSVPHPPAGVPQKPKHETPPPQHQPPPPPQHQPPPPPKQVLPKDPIAKVQLIQEAVNELKKKVESFSGSRSDKEYIYLDEMLTRNLLKLDDIETEGKDNIRQARKEAIRCIERCISLLESRAPLPQETNAGGAELSQTENLTDEKSCSDVCEEMSQSETVASGEANKVPLESMEVEQQLESQGPSNSEILTTEIKSQDISKSETPMEVTAEATTEKRENEGSLGTSEPEGKPKESSQNPEMMEVVPDDKSKNESPEVASAVLEHTKVEVQMSGGENIGIDTASTNGANVNCGHCDGSNGADNSGTEVQINVDEGVAGLTEHENAAGSEQVVVEGVVNKSDSSEPLNTENAQNESVEVTKDGASVNNVTTESIDILNVNDTPTVEAANKEVSS